MFTISGKLRDLYISRGFLILTFRTGIIFHDEESVIISVNDAEKIFGRRIDDDTSLKEIHNKKIMIRIHI